VRQISFEITKIQNLFWQLFHHREKEKTQRAQRILP
jgi:hypothetical protein